MTEPEETEEPEIVEGEPEETEEPEVPEVTEEEPEETVEPETTEEPEATEEPAPEPEITTITPDPVTYNGVTVTVSYPSDAFGKNVTLVVGEPGETEREALEALGSAFKAVDICFIDEEGNAVQPVEGKTVSVALKAEGMEAADGYRVAHVDAEGKVKFLEAETETTNEVTEQVKTGETTKTVNVPAETETVAVEDYKEETYTDYETRQTTVQVPAEISYRQVLRSREIEKKEAVVSLLKRLLTIPGKNNSANTKTVTEYYYETEPYVVREAYSYVTTESVPVERTRKVLAGTHYETRVIREAYSYEKKEDVFEDVTTNDVEATFDADSFSVYAVVENGSTVDEARLTVNFYNGSTKIATMYVKNSDDADDIAQIIYDPGIGTIPEDQLFNGWSLEQSYTTTSASYTIPQLRTYIANMPDWEEGDVLNIYARIFKVYTVTYLGVHNVSLGADSVLVPVGAPSGSYTVSQDYEPDENTELFEGWNVVDGGSNIAGHTTGKLYKLNNVITISGDVTFSITVAQGHWLVFHENGKGATYNAPQFYRADEVTTDEDLLEMQRVGYTFGGWYTDEACTTPFEFGHLLTDYTEIYAKWTPVQTANYVVLIWKQNASDNKNAADNAKTYDFTESVTLSGNVGTTVNTITATGTGDNRYASVNGTAKRYTGFHLNRYDTGVTITPEGDTVVNIYYDRNLVTLTFQVYDYTYTVSTNDNDNNPAKYGDVNGQKARVYWRNGAFRTSNTNYGTVYTGTVYTRSNNQSWHDYIEPMTGLYGSSISGNGYTWPTALWWYSGHNNNNTQGTGTHTTFLDAFLPPNGGSSMTFYGFDDSGSRNVYFYKKDADTGQYVLTNQVTASGTFNISDKYNGYRAVSYSTNNTTWTTLGDKDPTTGYYASVGTYTNLYIRFDPLLYNILYMDGVYVDGDGRPVPGYDEGRGELKVVEGIPYESSVSSYNKGGANYYAPTYDGFTFAGWYIDDACTQPYTFTNMPEGITVYAKWILNQYRVFLHSNAFILGPDGQPVIGSDGKPVYDSTLFWGTSNQAMSFRISGGSKVSLPRGTRSEYTFVGWYTDENTKTLYPADTELHDSTPYLTDYDKTVTMTDPMDIHGNITNPSAATNSDLTGYNGTERFWITKKMDLYAKWSALLPGAEGIGVVYDADIGSNAPTDNTLYKDNVDAVAQGAATAPAGKQFEKWMVQTWDETANKYVDTDVYVYPGGLFTVLKSNARVVVTGSHEDPTTHEMVIDSATYTVQLKAVYVDKDAPTPTHITWYGNGGTLNTSAVPAVPTGKTYTYESHTVTTTVEGLQINEKVPAGAANLFTRPGYKFVGWARETEPTGAYNREAETNKVDETKYSVNDNVTLWLKLNDDGTTYTEVGTTHIAVTEVAADEDTPYHAIYAVWEKDYFYIFHSSTGDLEAVLLPDEGETVDLTGCMPSGYLYGGYYKSYSAYTVTAADKANAEKSSTHTVHVTDDTYNPAKTAAHVGRWAKADAYTAAGTEMTPAAQTVYYLKEVPNTYLRPTHMTTYQRYDRYLRDLILFSTADDGNYTQTGFVVGSAYKACDSLSGTITINFGPNYDESVDNGVVTVDVNNTSANKGGYVIAYRLFHLEDETSKDYSSIIGNTLFKPYWITLDGITVTGAASRRETIKDKNNNQIIEVDPVNGADLKEITFKDIAAVIKAFKQ